MPDKTGGLIGVDKSNRKMAVDVLTRAFMDYPDLKYYFPEEPTRKLVTHHLLTLELYASLRYGEVYATPDLEGVEIWIQSPNYPVSMWRTLRSVPLSALIGFTIHGGDGLRRFGEYLDSVHRRLAPFQHWYLETIGVDPQFQGMGYASKLIKPMLSKIDQEGLPCYLETGSEKNVPRYEHFGFKVLEKSPVPGTPLTNWAMLREVHSGQ